jgi:signal transduction histidine kinase
MDADAPRGRTLIEESREAVVVLDDADTVLLASRRARQSIDGIRENERLPEGMLSGERGIVPLIVPYEVGGRRERLVYLSQVGDMTAYEELRTGFTAAVSHEFRSPLTSLRQISEMLSREAWRLLEGNYERVLQLPFDLEARAAMQLGAYYAGMAIELSMLDQRRSARILDV